MKALEKIRKIIKPIRILFVANLKQQTRSKISFLVSIFTPLAFVSVYVAMAFIFYEINPLAFQNLNLGKFLVALFWFRTLILFNYGLTTYSLRKLSGAIKNSDFDMVLMKPINITYFKYFWFFNIADFVVFLINFVGFLVAVLVIQPGYLFLVKATILFLPAFFARTFFLSIMNGLVFFFRSSDVFIALDRDLREVLTARPIEVFPNFIQFTITFILPFYIYYQFIFDVIRNNDNLLHWVVLAVWLVILYLANNFIWKKGIKKYESA